MKRLVPIAAVVAGVTLLGVLLWFVNGSQTFRFEKEVALSLTPEEVYLMMTDEKLQAKWSNGRQERKKLTTGPFGVGNRISYVLVDGDQRYEFEEEVIELLEPHRIVLKVSTELFETTQTYDIRSDGTGGSTLNVSVKGDLKGRAKWGGAYVRTAIEEAVAADLETLRWTITQTPDFRLLLQERARR